MKNGMLPRLCLLFAAVVLVTGFILFAMLIQYDRTSVSDLELYPVEIVGEYSEEGDEWKPLTREVFFQNLTYRDITVRGHFSRNLPENSKLFLNVDHLRMTLRVNGAEFFSIGPVEGDRNPTQALGKQWVTVRSPGITTEDMVELNFANLYTNAYIIQFDELLWQMHTGDERMMLLEAIRIDAWPLGVGAALLVLTLLLLAIAVGLAVMRTKGARWFLWLGLTTLFAACFFFPVSSALTLVLSLPVSQISLYSVGMQGMVIFLVLFIAEHLTKWRRYSLLGCVAVLLLVMEVAFINQVLSVQDLYMAVDYLSILDFFIVVWFVYCIYDEARREKSRDAAELLRAMIPFAVMSAVEIYNGFFQFGNTAVMLGIGLIAMIVVEGIYTLRRIHQSMENEKRVLLLENELQQSNLRIMLSQIQPHFLYNSLLGIKLLCDTDPPRASEALEHFSFYLRGNLDSLVNIQLVSFEKELVHIRDYLYLEKMRFSDKLNIRWDLQETDFLLPPLTVQPLIENAIRHGLNKKTGGGTLTIRSEWVGKNVIITIQDDGAGFDPTRQQSDGHTHIGIGNTRSRLATLCGGSLQIESEQNIGTTAKIILPQQEVIG